MEVMSVTSSKYSDAVEFSCVSGKPKPTGGGYEDNEFARATPSGSMKLQIDNPSLRGAFKPGMVCYVDIAEVLTHDNQPG